MDDRPHPEDYENIPHSPFEFPGSASVRSSAIFSNSQHFTVAGGTFMNITNNYTTSVIALADFRRIPMRDINLQNAIKLDEGSSRARICIRRMYTAKVTGRKSTMMVAMYQGEAAEEQWEQDIAKYCTVRHSNIVQIHAAASSSNIYAVLFHDDLVPFKCFLDLYRHSPIFTVYIYGYTSTEFEDVHSYFDSVFQHSLSHGECTFWIRRSSGRLCADLTPSQTYDWYFTDIDIICQEGITSSSVKPGSESHQLPDVGAVPFNLFSASISSCVCLCPCPVQFRSDNSYPWGSNFMLRRG
ncbi:hypothetical protein DFH06DRAFT_509871 [Mycena polygramma]|nr:hypothetical protein DFH06DRAFT_509871 [Mycena polygramma]